MQDSKTLSVGVFLFLLLGVMALLMGSTACTTNIDYALTTPHPQPPAVEVDIWIDSFMQVGAYESIDIIWVIDGSGSMSDNDAELLAGIEAMMNNLPSDINWRLKMITAGDYSYVVQSTTFPLTQGSTYKDALSMYSQLPNDGGESGFAALQNYVTTDTYAQTWLRRDAAMLVVFVSDEEEQSSMLVGDFNLWYQGLRNSAYMASIVNVDPIDSVCSYPPYGSSIGYRYIESTNYFNGNVIDICSSDWSSGVEEATSKIEPYESYKLTHLPQEDTIVVFEDSLPFHGWTYDAYDNTVYFDIIPSEGILMEIGYSVATYLVEDSFDTGILP